MIKSVMVDGAEALKLIVDGKVAWERGGLPAGYQKCAFLQSDGNQYLSVYNYIPQIGDSFNINFVNMHNNLGAIFSAGTVDYQFIALVYNDYYLFLKYFTNGNASGSLCQVREKPYKLRFFSDGKILFDGAEINSEVEKPKGSVNTNLHLFIRANLTNGFVGKILGFKAERNGNVIHNLVPCIDADGVPCMYDTVSKQSFYNQGTGEFLYELA